MAIDPVTESAQLVSRRDRRLLERKQMKSKNSNRLVTVPAACVILGGMSANWLWRNTAPRGAIPCQRVGRRVFYDVADLLIYAAERRLGGAV